MSLHGNGPVVVVGGGIAGVSFLESFAILCQDTPIELISSSPLLKVACNLRQTGIGLDEFEVGEESSSRLEATYRNASVLYDKVIAIDSQRNELRLESGIVKRYSKLCICTGGQPHLIADSKEFVVGIRDTDTVKDLQARLATARRVVVVGNGGIATELIYEIEQCQIVWAIKDKAIGSTFFDAVAAHFFRPKLTATKLKGNGSDPSKRLKYVVDASVQGREFGLGSALGPDWATNLSLHGTANQLKKNLIVEQQVEVTRIIGKDDLTDQDRDKVVGETGTDVILNWPVYVQLTNGKVYGCDFIVSATGVTPNSGPFIATGIDIADDGGLRVS